MITDSMYGKFISDTKNMIGGKYRETPSRVQPLEDFKWPTHFQVAQWSQQYCTLGKSKVKKHHDKGAKLCFLVHFSYVYEDLTKFGQ